MLWLMSLSSPDSLKNSFTYIFSFDLCSFKKSFELLLLDHWPGHQECSSEQDRMGTGAVVGFRCQVLLSYSDIVVGGDRCEAQVDIHDKHNKKN